MSGPTLAGASLGGLCPRCGSRTQFAGPLRIAPDCRACGLDLAAFNVGDGPAAFLILVVGALVATAAITVELVAGPPWWVHIIWLPVTVALTVGGLRIGKAALMFQEFRHRAGEGRVAQ
ncbi:DUF983 domain-containing protein [Sphingomonas mesophila]|uniref:DUF983 domain-containing protein n=1 Tax=Sphingomonas mesophila TaxID=2303576 RepID=UPI000E578120|nr:DUF983 domain-containing protein [Sphingomonas mesophila]